MSEPQMSTQKPNIVFVLTDQQRIDTIAANGYPHMITPNLDKLVERGTVFENMYVTSPSCSPSRASLFSGTYPHTNGVFRNDEPWSYCWVKELADAGYRCVNVGKMHTMPIEGSFGFHERHVVENKDRDHPNLPFYLDNWDKAIKARGAYKPSRVTYAKREDYDDRLGAFVWEQDKDLHPDVFVGQTACWWLERYPIKENEPFFLQIGLPGPHPPYDPTQEFLDMYLGRDLPMPIKELDVGKQPKPMRELRKNHLDSGHDAVMHLPEPTDEQMTRQRAHYYANVTMIDEQVGLVIAALKERGVLDNTVVVFSSDHGDCLNDHGHSQKWNMFESSVRVPAIVSWPGHVSEGKRSADLVSLMDFGPTILELAGIKPKPWMEAQSLLPQLFNQVPNGSRTRVFAEHSDDPILTGTRFMTMIREAQWKLVHFVDHSEGQLFDLSTDPQELNNLWGKAEHQATQTRLIQEILKWRIESSRKGQGFVQMLASKSV